MAEFVFLASWSAGEHRDMRKLATKETTLLPLDM
jgi:hypothetical protein